MRPTARTPDDRWRGDTEFAFEKEAGNVKDAIEQFGIRYPCPGQQHGTWNAYGNEDWRLTT